MTRAVFIALGIILAAMVTLGFGLILVAEFIEWIASGAM